LNNKTIFHVGNYDYNWHLQGHYLRNGIMSCCYV